jgi:two-component system, cell cycle sensor histidine kinase and response regulator CckA
MTDPNLDAPAARKWTILLAEDDAPVRDVVVRLLEALGCEVVAARDGEEAVALFQARVGPPIDLALVDRTMPKMGGEATLRELRRLAPALPLVLMSGYPEGEAATGLADVGLAAYLQKPFRLPALSEVLRRALGG